MAVYYAPNYGGGGFWNNLLGNVTGMAVNGLLGGIVGSFGNKGGQAPSVQRSAPVPRQPGSFMPQFGEPDYEDLWHGFNRRR